MACAFRHNRHWIQLSESPKAKRATRFFSSHRALEIFCDQFVKQYLSQLPYRRQSSNIILLHVSEVFPVAISGTDNHDPPETLDSLDSLDVWKRRQNLYRTYTTHFDIRQVLVAWVAWCWWCHVSGGKILRCLVPQSLCQRWFILIHIEPGLDLRSNRFLLHQKPSFSSEIRSTVHAMRGSS